MLIINISLDFLGETEFVAMHFGIVICIKYAVYTFNLGQNVTGYL